MQMWAASAHFGVKRVHVVFPEHGDVALDRGAQHLVRLSLAPRLISQSIGQIHCRPQSLGVILAQNIAVA